MPEMQKAVSNMNRHIVKLPQEEEEQKLSYQTNKLAQFIELQLSDLQNTLHYIQKKHSINQIKESISHAYSIFSQTEPVFRELRIVFIYDKIKKLVNCFSIIYLILMQHLEKPSRISIQQKDDVQQEGSIQQYEKIAVARRSEKNKNHENHMLEAQSNSNGGKKPKSLGGVHLYNQQYNRHIESDLDRLKRKLKEQNKEYQEPTNAKISEKQRLKEEIFKQINTDIYGSPSPDELTLFFNLNSNRYGSDLQYVTFQDELQQIAAFFKQSQDEALQFLNKSRDDFIFLNFNQGFKEMMVQYKVEKEEQVNGFVEKVKNLFQAIKTKTVQRENQINHQINQLKKLQQKIKKPFTLQIQTQTSLNYEEEIMKLKKKIEEVETNYKALQNYHNKENENDSKNMTLLEHKIAFKDHEISILKKQLQEKNHFIDFLNDKINNGTDPKVLRKISNIYRNHSKKNSSKIKVQLDQLEKDAGIDLNGLKQKDYSPSNDDQTEINKEEKIQIQGGEVERKSRQVDKNSFTIPFQDYEKPSKKKRKQGISFYASQQKRHASYIERNSSFNFQKSKIQQQSLESQKVTSGDIPSYDEDYEDNNDREKMGQSGLKKDKQKNMVKAQKRKSIDRNSLQMVQKSTSKNYEPKRSAFASGMNNSKSISNAGSRSGVNRRVSSSMKQEISEEEIRQSLEQEELMRQINGMGIGSESFEDGEDENEYDPDQYESNMEGIDESMDDEIDGGNANFSRENLKKRTSLNKGNSNLKKFRRSKIEDGSKNLDSDQSKKGAHQRRRSGSLRSSEQQNQLSKSSAFKRKQSRIENMSQQNFQCKEKYYTGKNSKLFGINPKNTPLNGNDEDRVSAQSREIISESNQENLLGESFQDTKRQKRKNQFRSQDMQENQQEQNQDFEEEYEQTQRDQDDDQNRFFKTFSGSSNFDNLSLQEKDNMISTYFTTIYKEKKIKSSNLCSGLVNVFIQTSATKDNQNQKKNGNQLINEALRQGFSKENNLSNLPNQKGPISKALEIKNNRKNSQLSGNLSYLNKSRDKTSVMQDSTAKLKSDEIISQSFIENLASFKEIDTEEINGEEETKQVGQSEEQKSKLKTNKIEKKPVNSTDYQKIYGISSAPKNMNKKQNKELALLNHQERQKMEEYLEKAAIKAAMKSKNVEEFKARIKKMHVTKCGQTCKHLERYLENFNKYRSCNRQILKIHVQNVHNFISQNNENFVRFNKENSITLPSLNLPIAAESSKGFSSIQRGLGTVTRK